MIKQKYFKFCCMYTVWNLFDSTNLIKLISPCFSYNCSVVDSLTSCVTFFFLKTHNWFCRMSLILILNSFLNSVNLFVFFCIILLFFFQNNVLLIFSDHSIHSAYLGHVMFVTTFYPPPSDWKWLVLHFLNMATSNKHMFKFLKLLQLIKCCHNWSLKKLKQYIKETLFTIILFYFFMCDDLSFINTTQKTLKKSFNSQDGWEKTSYPGIPIDDY